MRKSTDNTCAWEQRKAKELCNIGTGKSNTQDQVENGLYPFYIRSDIPVKSNKYLYDCEAVITIEDGNIGRVFHYVNGKFDLHQRCYKMTDFQDIWGKYFYYFFSTRFYDRAMKMTAKATVDSVRLEMISEMDIWKPIQIDEQKKIAEFFTNLDNLITLHQCKQNHKKEALMSYTLTKYEKETVLLYNQSHDPITISTYDPGLRRRLREFAARYPEMCRRVDKQKYPDYAEYEIKKDRVSIRLLPPMSEEKRRVASEKAKAAGLGTKGNA